MLQNIYQFKAKNSETKDYTMCLGNISKDFTINKMEKNGIRRIFSVDFNLVDNNNIHKYLMKRIMI